MAGSARIHHAAGAAEQINEQHDNDGASPSQWRAALAPGMPARGRDADDRLRGNDRLSRVGEGAIKRVSCQ